MKQMMADPETRLKPEAVEVGGSTQFACPDETPSRMILRRCKENRAERASEGDRFTMEKTLFEKYGGFSVVSRIVMDLYDRLLDDDDVGPFFDNVEMARIVDHQTKFVSSLMGGPASYSDDQIVRMHARLDIGTTHFDKLQELLSQTLADHGVAPEDVDSIVGAFEARRGLVVDR